MIIRWLLMAGLMAVGASEVMATDRAASSFRDCPDCPEMTAIPGQSYALGRFEVTFDDWDRCVAAGGCAHAPDDHGWGRKSRPVINVSFEEVLAYAAWLSRHTGQAYRLPREAEWAHAARAGAGAGGGFWWGDAVGDGHANCRGCGGKWAGRQSAPVGSFPANPYGLFDMNGNLWEWVAECWDVACQRRVIRGGAWYYIAKLSRADSRAPNSSGARSYTIGFRLLREQPVAKNK